MVIEFEKEYLSELYYEGKCNDKKHRFQPQVIRNYVKRIVTLAEALNVEALYPLNSLNYEVLTPGHLQSETHRNNPPYHCWSLRLQQ